jgi:DNA-binding transcriptional regulator YhcF (GntR family)
MAGWNKKSLPDAAIEKLGKLPDYILAKEYNVSKKTISRARNELKIKPYAQSTGNNGQFQKGQPHPRWQRQNTQSNYAPSRESKKTFFPRPPI